MIIMAIVYLYAVTIISTAWLDSGFETLIPNLIFNETMIKVFNVHEQYFAII